MNPLLAKKTFWCRDNCSHTEVWPLVQYDEDEKRRRQGQGHDKDNDKDKDKDKRKDYDGRKAQIPETAWHLALEELGDVEENCEEQDGEEVGEQVVPVLCCVLLPSGDVHEDEDDGHDDVGKNIAQDQLPVVRQGIVDSHVALQGNSDLLDNNKNLKTPNSEWSQKYLAVLKKYQDDTKDTRRFAKCLDALWLYCSQYCIKIVQIIYKVSGWSKTWAFFYTHVFQKMSTTCKAGKLNYFSKLSFLEFSHHAYSLPESLIMMTHKHTINAITMIIVWYFFRTVR